MDKPYDFKELAKMAVAEGLELTEESAKILNKVTFKWLTKSAELSASPLDNIAIPFYPMVEAKIAEYADKINPEG